ncbi:MAG: alpha/beta fold hydrolase [Leptothrix sp. (in: b-proteobacteria)]
MSGAPAAPDASDVAYTPCRASTSRFLPLRQVGGRAGLRCHLRQWGELAAVTPQRPLRVLLHGWMDVAASFQFVVDAMSDAACLVAPDWRGFGLSHGAPTDSFWFADYLADLDALLHALQPGQPVDLIGHSMGGNIAMLYAGVRPERVRRLINLEGFGMPPTVAAMAPTRLARWLDELREPVALHSYPSLDAVARRLRLNNPRLAPAHASWLAAHWSRADEQGAFHLLADAAHKRVNPMLARQDEALACWRRIRAPLLWVEGAQTQLFDLWKGSYGRADFDARLAEVAAVTSLQREVLDDCGHMLHHDQPQRLAQRIEAFLAA